MEKALRFIGASDTAHFIRDTRGALEELERRLEEKRIATERDYERRGIEAMLLADKEDEIWVRILFQSLIG